MVCKAVKFKPCSIGLLVDRPVARIIHSSTAMWEEIGGAVNFDAIDPKLHPL